jgi:hypothetical protein
MSLQAMAQASAEPGPNSPNIRVTPRIVHPGRFAGPDSVRFPVQPVIGVDITSTDETGTIARRSRKRAGSKAK